MENSGCWKPSQFWMAAAALTVLVLTTGCHCQSIYIVWWSEPNDPTYYQNWADEREFSVNDTLYFSYNSSLFNVVVVRRQDELDNCSITNDDVSDEVDITGVTFLIDNTTYYIMSLIHEGDPNCNAGMKFRLPVGQPNQDTNPSSGSWSPGSPGRNWGPWQGPRQSPGAPGFSNSSQQVEVNNHLYFKIVSIPWSPNSDANLGVYILNASDNPLVSFTNYSKSDNYSLNLVEEEDYNQCNSSNPLKTFKFGESPNFPKPGVFYIIDGNQNLCQSSGMRLNVTVIGSLNAVLDPGPGPSPSTNHSSPALDKLAIVILVIATMIAILAFITFQVLHHRNKRRCEKHNVMNGDWGQNGVFKMFTRNELKVATNNFSKDNELGSGGFGTVYKGVLKDGQVVAVKKAMTQKPADNEQFINEVSILSQVKHCNLVKLMGCCVDNKSPLVVYEFVPNGTLRQHLNKPKKLDWPHRLRIAIHIAQALRYLHSQANPPIVHRDIKTTNILLDDHFGAKVADFGLSKLFDVDVTHMSTAIRGTPGYMDPEYFVNSQLTEKSDVYSYGVVLLELITSKRPLDMALDSAEQNLAIRSVPIIENKNARDIIDTSLLEELSEKDFKSIAAVAQVAVACLAKDRASRPSMIQVVEMLSEISGLKLGAKTSLKTG
ncbi:unnamed protein product [Calypogeia fissa]